MKVAIALYRYFPYGGLQQDFKSCVETAVKLGFKCDVYVATWEGDKLNNVNIIQLTTTGFSNHTRMKQFGQQCNQHWQNKKYDAIIGFNKIPGLTHYFVGDTCFLAKAMRKWGKFYGLMPRYRTLVNLERSVFESDTTCFYLTEKEQKIVNYLYDRGNAKDYLLPLEIKEPYTNDKALGAEMRYEKVKETETVLLFVASHFKTKGLDRVINAMKRLPKKMQIQLWVVGGTEDNLSMKLSDDIRKKITFFESVDRVYPYYFAADILIHPARTELAGKVIVEAMNAGLAILTTGVCGFASHVVKGKAGIVLSEPFQPNALLSALKKMVEPNTLHQYQLHAKKYIDEIPKRPFAESMLDVISQ